MRESTRDLLDFVVRVIIVVVVLGVVFAYGMLIAQGIIDKSQKDSAISEADCIQKGGTWNVGRMGGRDAYWCSFPPQGR